MVSNQTNNNIFMFMDVYVEDICIVDSYWASHILAQKVFDTY